MFPLSMGAFKSYQYSLWIIWLFVAMVFVTVFLYQTDSMNFNITPSNGAYKDIDGVNRDKTRSSKMIFLRL